MQEQEAHYQKRSHKRFTLAIIIFLLLIGSGVFWIMNKDKGSWSSIFVIVFTVLGVVFALFQWLLPTSSEKEFTYVASDQERKSSPEQIAYYVSVPVEVEGVQLDVSNKAGALLVGPYASLGKPVL